MARVTVHALPEVQHLQYGPRLTRHGTIDISPHGMRFKSGTKLPVNAFIRLDLGEKGGKGGLQLAGLVRWIHHVGGDQMYDVGVEILDADAPHMESWTKYVNDWANF